VNEGIFRALRALAPSPHPDETEWARRSGEARSVLHETLRKHAKFIETTGPRFQLSRAGQVALGMEMCARHAAVEATDADEALAEFSRLAAARPAARRELDQIHATSDTSMRRARLLSEQGDVQRGLCLLGDDDLVSLALLATGVLRRTTVLDVDAGLLAHIDAQSSVLEADTRTVEHDLRQPIARELSGRFGCVFVDPPYHMAGFRLFVSRAIDLLKPDGRIWLAFGHSRRAPERGLAKQALLLDAGLVILDLLPDFNQYDGAESIGARSDLYLLGRTPKTRPPIEGAYEGDLYTSRSPQPPAN